MTYMTYRIYRNCSSHQTKTEHELQCPVCGESFWVHRGEAISVCYVDEPGAQYEEQ